MKTENYKIDLMIPMQTLNKEIIFNEAIVKLDSFCNMSINKFIDNIPENIENNQKYIITKGGHTNKICYMNNKNHGIELINPPNGSIFFIQEEKGFFIFNNNKWERIGK